MIVTEDEAKSKLCCRWLNNSSYCLASACMAWQFLLPNFYTHTGEHDLGCTIDLKNYYMTALDTCPQCGCNIKSELKEDCKRVGHCGLMKDV